MGMGSYYAVGFGSREIPRHPDEDLTSKLHDLFDEFGVQLGYESDYAAVVLIDTRDDRYNTRLQRMPGTIVLDKLVDTIKASIPPAVLGKAHDTWFIVKDKAKELGIELPDGELIWINDYD